MDAIAEFKEKQKAAWANFAVLEGATGTAAPHLVRFAGIETGNEVLDVACGTGVVALTAARLGAKVTGLDLTPELIMRAKENSALMKADVEWLQGDAEALPFEDARFDVVVSQFGHMFAPRPEVTIKQMLRVLKPGGTIAFATWPTETFVGRLFALIGEYAPPLPSGVSPPAQWGDVGIIRERLGGAVKELFFAREAMLIQTLSAQHYRLFMERSLGPLIKLLKGLDEKEPAKGNELRRRIEQLAAPYHANNTLRQDFLLTRAVKT